MPYPRRDFCAAGHPLSGANVTIRANGARRCLTCARRAARDAMRRLRARRGAGVTFGSVGALQATVDYVCGHCGRPFRPDRRSVADNRFCSESCLQASYGGQRHPAGSWALVTWQMRGDYTSKIRYFDTRAEALAAAPAGQPSTVVNRTVKARERLSIDEIVGRIARARSTSP
jgi:hypothetical protein